METSSDIYDGYKNWIIHSKELALRLEMLSKQEENYNNDYILFMLYIIIFTQIIFYLPFIIL